METTDMAAQLKEMGFSDDQATVALKHSTDKSLEGLINWLDANPNIEQFVAKETAGDKIEPEQPQGTQENAEPEGQSISHLINQEFAAGLESMGYSKNVREKALLMSGNASIEGALEWIEQNKTSPDFEEELRVMGGGEEKPKLTPEEAAERARELQILLRERRKKKDEEEAQQREKDRVASGKALSEAKRIMQEQEKQRNLEAFMKQKKEDEAYKQKMLEEYERERIARFGKEHATASKAQLGEKPEEKLNTAFKQMRVVYPVFNYPDTIKVCLTTIKTIIGNILKNPNEPKFQKINLSNQNFKARVGDVIGGTFILQNLGFEEEDGHLVLKDTKKLDFFPRAIELFDRETTSLNLT